MAIVIPPGYAHVDLAFRHEAYQRDAHLTYGISTAGDPTLLAGLQVAAWNTTMNPVLDNNVRLREATVTIGQDGGEPLVDHASNTTPGARGMDATTAALAVLVTKRTGFGGRRNVGRNFLPWCAADSEVSEIGLVSTVRVNALQTAVDNWLDFMDAAPAPMVLLRRSQGEATPPPVPVTSLVVSNVISTQRRRQVRSV